MAHTPTNHTVPSEFAALAESLRGTIITPGHPEYDSARTVWNFDHKANPKAIFRVYGVSDVQKVLKHINANPTTPPTPFTVRGGGHSTRCLCDGYVLDLSRMRSCRVDAETKTIRVDGGALLNDVYREAAAYNLFLPAGIVSTTGVGGLSLFGGIGWLAREFGLACDHILEVDLVTADGEVLVVNKDSYPDLFWAIRGAGGCFGTITSFKFQLVSSTTVFAGAQFYPIERTAEVFEAYRKVTLKEEEFPREYCVAFGTLVHGGNKLAGILSSYHGSEENGRKTNAPFAALGPAVTMLKQMPTVAWFTGNDKLAGSPGYLYQKGFILESLNPEISAIIIEGFAAVPNPTCLITLITIGGKMSEMPKVENAFAVRKARFGVNIEARWINPEEEASAKAWARSVAAKMEKFKGATTYVNFAVDEVQRGGEEFFGANFERLKQLKAKYDPNGRFRSVVKP